MPSLSIDTGGTLHVEDAGSGEPVVLVHGWSASSAVFGGLAAALSRSHRVIAVDLRGHGRSTPGTAFGLSDLARDLVLVFDGLGLDRAAVVAWSLGGQVALAAAPLLGPRLSRLVLLSSTPRFTAGVGWPHGLPAQSVEVLAHRVRRDPARAVARFWDGLFVDGELDLAGRARVERVRASIPLPPADALLRGLEVLAREDLRPLLPGVAAPALLVHGDADPICPAGASRAMAALLPRARLSPLPATGHAPLLSRPDAVAALVAPFLAGAEA